MPRPHLARIVLTPAQQQRCQRLRADVEMLAGAIGERHLWRYDRLTAAEQYVRSQLALTGLPVGEQGYDCCGQVVRNVILEMPGHSRPEEIVIVGAHYDTIQGSPGADDNASAVAGLLEIARELTRRRFRRTIRFVAFVNEEPPFYKTVEMGSLVYARRCRARAERITAMVNLEMIGRYSDDAYSQRYPAIMGLERCLPGRGNFLVIGGNLRSAGLVLRMCRGFRRSTKFPVLPFITPQGRYGLSMSDNWSFWQCGYPALMVTDTSFLRNRDYHGPSDLPSTLHYPATTLVTSGIAGAVAMLAREL